MDSISVSFLWLVLILVALAALVVGVVLGLIAGYDLGRRAEIHREERERVRGAAQRASRAFDRLERQITDKEVHP